MATGSGVWVFYFLQGENGESEETPNTFKNDYSAAQIYSSIMGKTRAMREKNSKAVAGSRKRRAEGKRREQREDKIKRLRETRWKAKLESNRKELRRKRETLTKEDVRSGTKEIRLGLFLQAFPLHGYGEFYFRFRAPDEFSGYCWVDLSDPNAVLPRYDNVICAKVLRLDRLPKPRASRLRRKAPPAAGVPGSRASFGGRGPSRPKEVAQDVGHGKGHGQGHWPGQGPNRARSASPAAHHHDPNEIQGEMRGEKSAGPPPPTNHIGGVRVPGTGGRVSPSAGLPPQSAAQENLEAFLASDSPISSPRVGTAASPGGGVGQGFGRGEHTNFDAKLKPVGKTRAGTADSADLLNFESDAAGPATGVRRRAGGSSLGGGSHGAGSSQRPWHVSGGGGLKHPNARSQPPPSQATGQGSSANARQRNSVPSPEGVGAGAASGTANGTAGSRRMSHPSRPAASMGGGGSNGTEATAAAENRSASPAGDADGREQQIRDGAEAAKQAIKERDRAAAQDQEDMDAANQRIGAVLTAWAQDHGQKKNVRTLLSTMHTVLWEGHSWRPVDMADVIQPSGVKKAYRKAMLLVHPDKCRHLGPEQRFIAKRVFEAVNEAYTIFAEKEM